MLFAHQLKLVLLLLYWKKCLCALEANVVGGTNADIKHFPHSASISSSCISKEGPHTHLCGASILNNRVLLTAAHCLDECSETSVDIIVTVGHSNKREGKNYMAWTFYLHEEYDPDSNNVENDIALVGVQYLTLGDTIARVSIMKNPPYNEAAYVAGWGRVSDEPVKLSPKLKKLYQTVISYDECSKLLPQLPRGTICGGKLSSKSYTTLGDSGDALIVKNYIQIGINSHKIKAISNSVAVYTDVGYFYEWITTHAKMVYCSVRRARNLKGKNINT